MPAEEKPAARGDGTRARLLSDHGNKKAPPDFAVGRSPGSCERYLRPPLFSCASTPVRRARCIQGTRPHVPVLSPTREETRLLLRGLRRRLLGRRCLLHRCRRLRRGCLDRSLGWRCFLRRRFCHSLCSRLLGRCCLLCRCSLGLGRCCLLHCGFRRSLCSRLLCRCCFCLGRCGLRLGSGCCFLHCSRGLRRCCFYWCFLCRCLGCRRFG